MLTFNNESHRIIVRALFGRYGKLVVPAKSLEETSLQLRTTCMSAYRELYNEFFVKVNSFLPQAIIFPATLRRGGQIGGQAFIFNKGTPRDVIRTFSTEELSRLLNPSEDGAGVRAHTRVLSQYLRRDLDNDIEYLSGGILQATVGGGSDVVENSGVLVTDQELRFFMFVVETTLTSTREVLYNTIEECFGNSPLLLRGSDFTDRLTFFKECMSRDREDSIFSSRHFLLIDREHQSDSDDENNNEDNQESDEIEGQEIFSQNTKESVSFFAQLVEKSGPFFDSMSKLARQVIFLRKYGTPQNRLNAYLVFLYSYAKNLREQIGLNIDLDELINPLQYVQGQINSGKLSQETATKIVEKIGIVIQLFVGGMRQTFQDIAREIANFMRTLQDASGQSSLTRSNLSGRVYSLLSTLFAPLSDIVKLARTD